MSEGERVQDLSESEKELDELQRSREDLAQKRLSLLKDYSASLLVKREELEWELRQLEDLKVKMLDNQAKGLNPDGSKVVEDIYEDNEADEEDLRADLPTGWDSLPWSEGESEQSAGLSCRDLHQGLKSGCGGTQVLHLQNLTLRNSLCTPGYQDAVKRADKRRAKDAARNQSGEVGLSRQATMIAAIPPSRSFPAT